MYSDCLVTDEANLEGLRVERPLVLVGLMGVGKTTVGRRLAARLGLPFEDADDAIEQAAGMAVADIFACFGEPEFRRGEQRVIERLLQGPPKVIATGGGAFVQPQTRAAILARGIAIWLDADIETLVERTARRDTRPLLRNGDPRQILTELAERRAPYYAQAPLHVRSTDGPHDATVAAILELLRRHLQGAA